MDDFIPSSKKFPKLPYSVVFECSGTNPNYLLFTGSRKKILECFALIWNEFKNPTFTENDVNEVRKKLINTTSSNFKNMNNFHCLIPSFSCLVRDFPTIYDLLQNLEKSSCNFYHDYYVTVNGIGCINEEDLQIIFDSVKSTGKKELNTCRHFNANRFSFETYDKINNGLLVAYEIKKTSESQKNSKTFAIALILKTILKSPLHSLLRIENSISYMNSVEALVDFHKYFIGFFVQSTLDLANLEKIILEFSKKINDLINNFNDADFENLKTELANSYRFNIPTVQAFQTLFIISSFTQHFELNSIEILIDSILSVTKKDIIEAKIFENLPIVIHSTPIESS